MITYISQKARVQRSLSERSRKINPEEAKVWGNACVVQLRLAKGWLADCHGIRLFSHNNSPKLPQDSFLCATGTPSQNVFKGSCQKIRLLCVHTHKKRVFRENRLGEVLLQHSFSLLYSIPYDSNDIPSMNTSKASDSHPHHAQEEVHHSHDNDDHGRKETTVAAVTVTKATYLFVFCASLNSCNLGFDIGVSTEAGRLIQNDMDLTRE